MRDSHTVIRLVQIQIMHLRRKKSVNVSVNVILFNYAFQNEFSFCNGAQKFILPQMEHENINIILLCSSWNSCSHTYRMHLQLYTYFIITAFFLYSFSVCLSHSVCVFQSFVIACYWIYIWCDGIWTRFARDKNLRFLSPPSMPLMLSHRYCRLTLPLFRYAFHRFMFFTQTESRRILSVVAVQTNGSKAFHFIIHILFAFNFHIFRSKFQQIFKLFSFLCIAFINILLVLYTKICHFVHYFHSRW